MKIKIGNKTFEVTKEELESNPEEITIEFDGVLRTPEEESTFIENHKKEARKEGLEIAVKQHRDEYGFTGRKIENLIEAVKRKAVEDAQIAPNEQIDKLQGKLDEKEQALQNALQKVNEKEVEFKAFKNQTRLDRQLDSYLPDNLLVSNEDMKMILKSKLNFDVDEDGRDIVKDSFGNVIKDTTTADPVNPKDVVSNFFKDNQNYLKPVQGGAGGDDSKSKGGKKTIDDFIEDMKGQDIRINSPEFNEKLNSAIEAGTVEV